MMNKNKKKVKLQTKLIITICGITFLFMSGLATYNNMATEKMAKDFSNTILKLVGEQEKLTVELGVTKIFEELYGLKGAIVSQLEANNKNKEYIENLLISYLKYADHKSVTAVGVAFEDDLFDYGKNFSVYVAQKDGVLFPTDEFLESDYSEDYYIIPIKSGKAYMTDSYEIEVADGVPVKMFTYSIPIEVNGKTVGCILVDFFFDFLQDKIASIVPLGVGEVKLLGQAGGILGASIKGLSREEISEIYLGKTIYELGIWDGEDIVEHIKKNESKTFIEKDSKGRAMICALTPIEISEDKHWGVVIQVPLSYVMASALQVRYVGIMANFIIILTLIVSIIKIVKMNVIKPMQHLVNGLNLFANGDLSWSLPKSFLNSNDEWGDVAISLNNTLSKLRESLSRVKETAKHISVSSDDLNNSNNNLSVNRATGIKFGRDCSNYKKFI